MQRGEGWGVGWSISIYGQPFNAHWPTGQTGWYRAISITVCVIWSHSGRLASNFTLVYTHFYQLWQKVYRLGLRSSQVNHAVVNSSTTSKLANKFNTAVLSSTVEDKSANLCQWSGCSDAWFTLCTMSRHEMTVQMFPLKACILWHWLADLFNMCYQSQI